MSLPWEKRKKKCGNCKHWLPPADPEYMGRCALTFYDPGSVRGSFAYALEGGYLTTSKDFYCMQYWRKEASDG